MASANVTSKDRERLARARELGQLKSQDPSAIVGARYDPRRDALDLNFASGGTITIPRELIPGLEAATPQILASVAISPARDAISWRLLDIDVYVPGLIERVFGSRLFAASTGRQGGRRRSKLKAAAARANGTKGGRPRKHLTA